MKAITYHSHSYLFLLFKAQSVASVTPPIPGKWRVEEIKASLKTF